MLFRNFFPLSPPFELHRIQLHENDRIVLFSDGLVDQFGGEKGNDRTIDDVLEYLKNYKAKSFEEAGESWQKFSREYYDGWIPVWEAQAKRAYEWLSEYKVNHGF